MSGWGLSPWGLGPWGLGGAIVSVSPAVLPDEGGELVTITGSFFAGRPAVVEIGGASCPLPSLLGGVDASGGIPGTGPTPVANGAGDTILAVSPQLPVGVYAVTVQQPGGALLTLPAAFTVVRRDYWTRLHALRRLFPAPPEADEVIGAKLLRHEGLVHVTSAGQRVPAQQGMIQAIAAAIAEASGVLYTRTVAPPWRVGSTARVYSSAGGDVGQVVTVRGRNLSGQEQTETLVLAGMAPVVGTRTWEAVTGASLDVPAVGTVTVADDAGTPPERIAIGPGYARKAAGELHAGDTLIVVDGCYRFPDSGTLALSGERVAYSAKTMGTAYNAFMLSAPLARQHDLGATVADASRSLSAVDVVRRALLPNTAEGADLDAVARRWGALPRPPGLTDALYRALVNATAYGPVGTMLVITALFDELLGSGNYAIVEDLISFTEVLAPDGSATRSAVTIPGLGHPCTVFVSWGALLVSHDPRGKTFFCGGENTNGIGGTGAAKLSTSAVTAEANFAVSRVYGVYRQADVAAGLGRSVNYATRRPAGDGSVVVPGARVTSAGAFFVAGDLGKRVTLRAASLGALNEGIFDVAAVDAGGAWIDLDGYARPYGHIDPGSLDVFSVGNRMPAAACPFGPSWIGRTITVTIGGVPATRMILLVLDQRSVVVSAAFPAAGTDLAWTHDPVLLADPTLTWEILRATAAGTTITFPTALPAHPEQVVLDYTAQKSGVVFIDEAVANPDPSSCYPFYLGDADAWLRDLLDELTVAGVIAEKGDPAP